MASATASPALPRSKIRALRRIFQTQSPSFQLSPAQLFERSITAPFPASPGKAHMHALKHSCGTHLRERGETAEVIQDWLGHRDPRSTDIYLHFTRRRREEAVERNRDW
jgi:site-specific recombinase XerD